MKLTEHITLQTHSYQVGGSDALQKQEIIFSKIPTSSFNT